VSAFPVDRDGGTLETAPGLLFQARLGGVAHQGADPKLAVWMAELELDLRGSPTSPDLAGVGFPYERDVAFELRRAYLRYAFAPQFRVAAGAMTNHWGLGLVANDGAHGWTADSGRFADPVSGDRVGRVAAMFGPYRSLGGTMIIAAADYVLGDDVLLDDRAVQAIAAIQVGLGAPLGGGVYLARRHQWTDEGYTLDAWVVDGALRAEKAGLGPDSDITVKLEAEGVVVAGDTSLAPTMDYPSQHLLQLGAALRTSVSGSTLGGVLDVLFASGDQNMYDDTQHGFRPDPNYDFGLLLYRVVLAGQSGRGAGTAGDPMLVGYAAQGVDRIPTRGSATNTLAVFPRAVYRPGSHTSIYGGPLFAFAPAPVTDPFASRIASTNVNALGGEPGRVLGIEVDAGIRHRFELRGISIALGLEAGALFPGNAFVNATGDRMSTVWGGRFLLQANR